MLYAIVIYLEFQIGNNLLEFCNTLGLLHVPDPLPDGLVRQRALEVGQLPLALLDLVLTPATTLTLWPRKCSSTLTLIT